MNINFFLFYIQSMLMKVLKNRVIINIFSMDLYNEMQGTC